MTDAPSLAAMIAAVRHEAEENERCFDEDGGGAARLSAHITALRATVALLERLADVSSIAMTLCSYPSGPSYANSCCQSSMMGERRCEQMARKLAALLAQAGGGK